MTTTPSRRKKKKKQNIFKIEGSRGKKKTNEKQNTNHSRIRLRNEMSDRMIPISSARPFFSHSPPRSRLRSHSIPRIFQRLKAPYDCLHVLSVPLSLFRTHSALLLQRLHKASICLSFAHGRSSSWSSRERGDGATQSNEHHPRHHTNNVSSPSIFF